MVTARWGLMGPRLCSRNREPSVGLQRAKVIVDAELVSWYISWSISDFYCFYLGDWLSSGGRVLDESRDAGAQTGRFYLCRPTLPLLLQFI